MPEMDVKTAANKRWHAHLDHLYEELHKTAALSTTSRAVLGDSGRFFFETVYNHDYSGRIQAIWDQIKYCESQIEKCHEG